MSNNINFTFSMIDLLATVLYITTILVLVYLYKSLKELHVFLKESNRFFAENEIDAINIIATSSSILTKTEQLVDDITETSAELNEEIKDKVQMVNSVTSLVSSLFNKKRDKKSK